MDGNFIGTRSDADDLLKQAIGDNRIIKEELGIPANAWNAPLIRIDVTNPLLYDARLASGLESGANPQFRWGGYTSGGLPEVVVRQVPKSGVTATVVTK